jgi:hypothetical protein
MPSVRQQGIQPGALLCHWVSQAGSDQIMNICSHYVVTETQKPAWILAICENCGVVDKPELLLNGSFPHLQQALPTLGIGLCAIHNSILTKEATA